MGLFDAMQCLRSSISGSGFQIFSAGCSHQTKPRCSLSTNRILSVPACLKNPETVCAAGRLKQSAGFESAPATHELICAWFEYQAYSRVFFGGVGGFARLNAPDFGLLGPPSITMHGDVCNVKVHGESRAEVELRLSSLASRKRAISIHNTISNERLM
jgi:hypothetical protein